MAERYDPAEIDARWQRRWAETGIYEADADPDRPKQYVVTMYPYPSGDLHVGHWYPVAPTDARVRYLRMRGYNVLFPIGFDAFGLPAENAAIRNNIHPREWTYHNIRRMEEQLRQTGASFDWRREIITCDPEYYRWNQWFFLKMYERGLAYRKYAPVDWCPSCNTTLAREQVIGQDRRCERCNAEVTKKELEQWYLRITDYVEELLQLDSLDWPDHIRTLQRHWIGKSEGAEFAFHVQGLDESFRVFTTRPDTIFGVTFCVLAPEHPLVPVITTPDQRAVVDAYVAQAVKQTEVDRLNTEKERTGVATGAFAVHPLTGEPVPVFVGDYVLITYGTGAIMAVPAHDERDHEFARRMGLPIPQVIVPPGGAAAPEGQAYTGEGVMVNSGPFTGLASAEGKVAVAAELEHLGIGGPAVTYRLRDWLISRQRMWGTPIPMVYCPACGEVPVPESALPVLLPSDVDFRPTGESPLKYHPEFRNVACPRCGGGAERETDTMDTFVDSSWYTYRYLTPRYAEGPFDLTTEGAWLPVDLYTGGAEHAVMHLLYARFFHKVMRDMGLLEPWRRIRPEVNWDEPFPRLFSQGIITSFAYKDADGRYVSYGDVDFTEGHALQRSTREALAESAEKMSKSRFNVVAPDEYVRKYGADVVRLFLMFLGPWEQGGAWNPRGVEGIVRFLNRVWTLVTEPQDSVPRASAEDIRALQRALHQTLRKVTRDYERFSFNTAIAALMELVNTLFRLRPAVPADSPEWCEARRVLVLMLAPIAPHLAEEVWERLGGTYSVHQQPWPEWDESLAADEEIEIAVQVNGKVRDRIRLPVGAGEDTVRAAVLGQARIRELLETASLRKFIYVPGRLVNLVVS